MSSEVLAPSLIGQPSAVNSGSPFDFQTLKKERKIRGCVIRDPLPQ
jgi:hypothetical protein